MNGAVIRAVALAAAVGLGLAAPAIAAPDAPLSPSSVAITLQPGPSDAGHLVPYIDVTVVASGLATGAHAPLLSMPLVLSNTVTKANELQNLAVQDLDGPLPLVVTDDPEHGDTFYRHWTATRATHGDLTLHYRVAITNALPPRGAAPPLDLRTDDDGFGGLAGTFLILPESTAPGRVFVHWDLSRMPSGATSLSSFGPGDIQRDKITIDQLAHVYFMAGEIGLYPNPSARSGFDSAWEGKPGFDAQELMVWTANLYTNYVKFFEGDPRDLFVVFLRNNLVNAGGGFELGNAFIGSYGANVTAENFRFALAHEMVHGFVHTLDGPPGSDLANSWFAEGTANFYSWRLMLRFHKMSDLEYMNEINGGAAVYYTDIFRNAPNAAIPAGFWKDSRIRLLAYYRSPMYFAKVDKEMRDTSGGKRSLDDLLMEMLARRRSGRPMDEAAWIDVVTKALGPQAREEYRAFSAGALIVPDSDAFGPCGDTTLAFRRRC